MNAAAVTDRFPETVRVAVERYRETARALGHADDAIQATVRAMSNRHAHSDTAFVLMLDKARRALEIEAAS